MDTRYTDPHGAQKIDLVEDAPSPGDRIYAITDAYEPSFTGIRMLGSELDSLCAWWLAEKERR